MFLGVLATSIGFILLSSYYVLMNFSFHIWHRLYEIRKNGITSFHGGKIFHKLRTQRMSKIRDKRSEQFNTQWEWKQLMPNLLPTSVANNPLTPFMIVTAAGVKRKSTPLDILGNKQFSCDYYSH